MFYIQFNHLNSSLLESLIMGLTPDEVTGICTGEIILSTDREGTDIIADMLDAIRHGSTYKNTTYQWIPEEDLPTPARTLLVKTVRQPMYVSR